MSGALFVPLLCLATLSIPSADAIQQCGTAASRFYLPFIAFQASTPTCPILDALNCNGCCGQRSSGDVNPITDMYPGGVVPTVGPASWQCCNLNNTAVKTAYGCPVGTNCCHSATCGITDCCFPEETCNTGVRTSRDGSATGCYALCCERGHVVCSAPGVSSPSDFRCCPDAAHCQSDGSCSMCAELTNIFDPSGSIISNSSARPIVIHRNFTVALSAAVGVAYAAGVVISVHSSYRAYPAPIGAPDSRHHYGFAIDFQLLYGPARSVCDASCLRDCYYSKPSCPDSVFAFVRIANASTVFRYAPVFSPELGPAVGHIDGGASLPEAFLTQAQTAGIYMCAKRYCSGLVHDESGEQCFGNRIVIVQVLPDMISAGGSSAQWHDAQEWVIALNRVLNTKSIELWDDDVSRFPRALPPHSFPVQMPPALAAYFVQLMQSDHTLLSPLALTMAVLVNITFGADNSTEDHSQSFTPPNGVTFGLFSPSATPSPSAKAQSSPVLTSIPVLAGIGVGGLFVLCCVWGLVSHCRRTQREKDDVEAVAAVNTVADNNIGPTTAKINDVRALTSNPMLQGGKKAPRPPPPRKAAAALPNNSPTSASASLQLPSSLATSATTGSATTQASPPPAVVPLSTYVPENPALVFDTPSVALSPQSRPKSLFRLSGFTSALGPATGGGSSTSAATAATDTPTLGSRLPSVSSPAAASAPQSPQSPRPPPGPRTPRPPTSRRQSQSQSNTKAFLPKERLSFQVPNTMSSV